MTREEIEALSADKIGKLFIDGDEDCCIDDRRDRNLVFCPARDDGDIVDGWPVLNPDVIAKIVYRYNAAPDLARALLATLDEIEQLRETAGDNYFRGIAKGQEAYRQINGPLQIIDSPELATLRAANAALTARNEALRAFIEDFASAKIEALRIDMTGLSPEDEPDPVVEATEVWAWQEDARAALKETPNA